MFPSTLMKCAAPRPTIKAEYRYSTARSRKVSFGRQNGHKDHEYLNAPIYLAELQQYIRCKGATPGLYEVIVCREM